MYRMYHQMIYFIHCLFLKVYKLICLSFESFECQANTTYKTLPYIYQMLKDLYFRKVILLSLGFAIPLRNVDVSFSCLVLDFKRNYFTLF